MRTFPAAPDEIAAGVHISAGGKTECMKTHETLREGDRVIVLFQRGERNERWSRAGVYAPDYSIVRTHIPLEAVDEFYVDGRLAVASDSHTQTARLVLVDVDVCEIFPAHVGRPEEEVSGS